MTDNFDSLFKDGLEKVKPGTEMMQQDWEAMKSLLLTTPAPNAKLNGSIIGKKIFVAVSIGCVVLVAAYLLLPAKKTTQQSTELIAAKATAPVHPQVTPPKNIDTSLATNRGNITNHKENSSPKPYFTPVDTSRADKVALQDSTVVTQMDNPVAKTKTDAAILDSFYNLLKTPTQVFAIDNTNDTTIVGKDSSEITIPANCFINSDGVAVTGKVNLLLDECYSYTDLVANKLYTLSNGNLLQSGGMLQIKATASGKSLELNKNKQLLVKMPTKKFDESMQLYVQKKEANKDTTGAQINWVQSGQPQTYKLLPTVKVLNLWDDPFDVVVRHNKSIAKYKVPRKCTLNKLQIIAELKKRYPYYDEIKIRRVDSAMHTYEVRSFSGRPLYSVPVIGDTIDVTPATADRWKFWTTEQKEQYYKKLKADSAYRGTIGKLENKYNFSISNLGWINCDYFHHDRRPKVNYVVNLNDTALLYASQLLFLNCRLMMPAQVSGNYISFAGLPEGEPVQLVSIGVKNGKVVASVQKFTVSKTVVNNIVYQEVGAEELKKQLRLSDIK